MADNVAVTPGAGATIATDQVGSAHHQIVKLADGTADSATRIAADVGAKANALRVVPASDVMGVGAAASALRVVHANDALVSVQGGVAHDAPDDANPVKVGAKAVNMDGTEPGTPVTENDRANCRSDLYGRLLVEPVHPAAWSATADYAGAQTKTELKAAPAAGYSLYVTDIVISNGATAGTIKLIEDTAGAATDKVSRIFLAINGPISIRFATPIKLTAAKNLGVTSVTVTTHTITVNGYTAP